MTAQNTVPADPIDGTARDDSRKVTALMERASRLHHQGQVDKVEPLLLQVLDIAPKHTEALFNLGIINRDRNDSTAAERYFRRLIAADPDHVDAYQALADLFFNKRILLSAIETYESGLKRMPTRLPLLVGLLMALLSLRSARRVAEVCRRILEIDIDHCDARSFLAWSILAEGGDLEEALAIVDHALALNPDFARAMVAKWACLVRLGRGEEADALWRELSEAASDSWKFCKAAADFSNLAMNTAGAVALVSKYIERHPEDNDVFNYMAQTVMMDGDFHAGQDFMNKVLEAVPDNSAVRMAQALNAFRLGDFKTFHQYHWTRWGRDGSEQKWNLSVDDWKGEPVRDKALVIYSEQGIGDHVMWAAFLPVMAELAPKVYVETNARLNSLFARSFLQYAVITRDKLPKDWDVRNLAAKASSADLPDILNLDFNNTPGRDGFLIADPQWVQKLRQKYQAMFPGKRLVGISWRSGNRDSAGLRSVELPLWQPILSTPGYAFINLQYGDVSRDLELVRNELGVTIYNDPAINPLGSMDPFAAQIAALDLVVSVDNSTIHFAGALGKPTWAMLPINSDWRWLIDRRDAVWYSSLELFRQRPGDTWGTVIEEVAGRLKSLTAEELSAAEDAMLQRCGAFSLEHGRYNVAEHYYRALLAKRSHRAEALRAIGICARQAGHADKAVAIIGKAVELEPDNIDFLADLAIALNDSGEHKRSVDLGRQILRKDGRNVRALLAMGRILTGQEKFDEATDFFARVLRDNPAHVESRTALARAQSIQGEWVLARENFRRAIAYAPLDPLPHVGLAEASLRLGDYESGWQEFRWRFGSGFSGLPPHLAIMDPADQPEFWEKGNLRKARLFLRAERNAVEQILLMSQLPVIVGETRSVLAEIDPALLALAQATYPKVDFVPGGSTDPAILERHKVKLASSLGDLARRFRAGPASFNSMLSLRLPDGNISQSLRAEYQACFAGRKLIGLAWRNGNGHDHDTLLPWLPLFAEDGVGVVAVQIGADVEKIRAFGAESGCNMILDPRIDGARDLAEYAAQLASVDLVIAVDDLTAVLAAALGKPVLKPVSAADHWCWGAEGERIVWSDKVRVLRYSAGIDRLVGSIVSSVRK